MTLPKKFYILIVDDEADLRGLLQETLEASYPAVVMQADDGEDARALLKACVFDLIIADIHMPKCDGIELFKWIVQNQPGIHRNFIFLSGAARERSVISRLETLPPVPLVHKPFSLAGFLDLISGYLRRTAPSVRWEGERS